MLVVFFFVEHEENSAMKHIAQQINDMCWRLCVMFSFLLLFQKTVYLAFTFIGSSAVRTVMSRDDGVITFVKTVGYQGYDA